MRRGCFRAAAVIAAFGLGVAAAGDSVALAKRGQLVSPVSAQASRDPGPDFNGDGYADLAVGIPEETVGNAPYAGAVEVIYGSSEGLNGDKPIDDQIWTEDDFPISTILPERDDHFGWALAAGDFNADGFDDLAIGVPNQDVIVSGSNRKDAGAIYVLQGSASGLTRGGGLFTQHSKGIAGVAEPEDHFGYSLAVGDFGRGRMDDLAVGVPYEDVRSSFGGGDQGAVNVLYGTPGGLTGLRSTYWPQRNKRPGERFAFSLAAGDLHGSREDDLVIGAPFATVATLEAEEGKWEYGVVFLRDGTPRGLPTRGVLWGFVQGGGRRGLPGVPERGDHFGWSLAVANFGKGTPLDLAIGAPDDGPGSTGSVTIVYNSTFLHLGEGRKLDGQRWSQGSPHIAGDPDRGDSFGWSLAAANFGRTATDDLAIGVPGDLGKPAGIVPTKGHVGAVNVLFGTSKGLTAISNDFIWQDESDIEGDSENGDKFGWSLAAANFGKGAGVDLAIGVPGENMERMFQPDLHDVGAVNVLYGNEFGVRPSGDQFWWQASDSLHDSAENNDQFGIVLAH